MNSTTSASGSPSSPVVAPLIPTEGISSPPSRRSSSRRSSDRKQDPQKIRSSSSSSASSSPQGLTIEVTTATTTLSKKKKTTSSSRSSQHRKEKQKREQERFRISERIPVIEVEKITTSPSNNRSSRPQHHHQHNQHSPSSLSPAERRKKSLSRGLGISSSSSSRSPTSKLRTTIATASETSSFSPATLKTLSSASTAPTVTSELTQLSADGETTSSTAIMNPLENDDRIRNRKGFNIDPNLLVDRVPSASPSRRETTNGSSGMDRTKRPSPSKASDRCLEGEEQDEKKQQTMTSSFSNHSNSSIDNEQYRAERRHEKLLLEEKKRQAEARRRAKEMNARVLRESVGYCSSFSSDHSSVLSDSESAALASRRASARALAASMALHLDTNSSNGGSTDGPFPEQLNRSGELLTTSSEGRGGQTRSRMAPRLPGRAKGREQHDMVHADKSLSEDDLRRFASQLKHLPPPRRSASTSTALDAAAEAKSILKESKFSQSSPCLSPVPVKKGSVLLSASSDRRHRSCSSSSVSPTPSVEDISSGTTPPPPPISSTSRGVKFRPTTTVIPIESGGRKPQPSIIPHRNDLRRSPQNMERRTSSSSSSQRQSLSRGGGGGGGGGSSRVSSDSRESHRQHSYPHGRNSPSFAASSSNNEALQVQEQRLRRSSKKLFGIGDKQQQLKCGGPKEEEARNQAPRTAEDSATLDVEKSRRK